MSEYIITIDDWFFKHVHERYTHFFGCPIEEIVRCRDCKKLNIVGECPCGFWALENLNGFCAWGERANFATCECGEDIELGNRESAVCPRCNRTVRA